MYLYICIYIYTKYVYIHVHTNFVEKKKCKKNYCAIKFFEKI